jgi:hypothetical protein
MPLNDVTPEIVNMALDIADEAAESLIETHGRRTDKEGRWYDVAGEPVQPEVAYLKARGLAVTEPWSMDSLVCLTSE